MRLEDKRILRQAMREIGLARTALDAFDFAGARVGLGSAAGLLSLLASNVYLNEVSEKENPNPHVLRA